MLLAKPRAPSRAAPRPCAWLAIGALLSASCQMGSEPASWSVTRASVRSLEGSSVQVHPAPQVAGALLILVVVPLAIDVVLLPFTLPYDRAQRASTQPPQ